MYVGYAATQEWPTAGSTSGFTYDVSSAGDLFVYNTDASGAPNPLATQSPAGSSYAVAATLKATATTANVVTAVGSLAVAEGTGQSTLSVNPQHVGDALILGVGAVSSSSIDVTAVSGGGATWQKITNSDDTTAGLDSDLWLGTVTTTGSSTITVSYSASVTSITTELTSQEYSSSAGVTTNWAIANTGHSDVDSASTTVTFPSLSTSSAGRALRWLRPDTQRRDRWVDERFYL